MMFSSAVETVLGTDAATGEREGNLAFWWTRTTHRDALIALALEAAAVLVVDQGTAEG